MSCKKDGKVRKVARRTKPRSFRRKRWCAEATGGAGLLGKGFDQVGFILDC